MAISHAVLLQGANTFIADVTASADGDTTGSIPHGLPSVPLALTVTLLNSSIGASILAAWTAEINGPDILIEKTADVGSGSASPTARIMAAVPHSLVR